ncbi:MAG: transposase [Bacteriovorax sp.]|nr:transposase [Bacteriovorax sp.]
MKLKVKKTEQKRRSYDTSFKEQAVALAKEIGMKEAKDKLGISSDQILSNWVRASKKENSDSTHAEFLVLKEENKKLKRELKRENKVTLL